MLLSFHVENQFILSGDRQFTPVRDLEHFRLKEKLQLVLIEHYVLLEDRDNLFKVHLELVELGLGQSS